MEDDELEFFYPISETASDPAIFGAIGQVAASWARFEFVFNEAIRLMAGISADVGECLTAQIGGISLRFDAYSALCHLKGCSPKRLKELNSLRDGVVVPLSLKRNRIVHDPWMSGVQTGKPYRLEITARRKRVSEFKPHTVEEVRGVAKEIDEMMFGFIDLDRRIRLEMRSSSPEKQT